MIDVELAVRTWLDAEFPAAHVSTEAPVDITGPTIRAVGGPGGNVNNTLERALVDVDCWDLTRDEARKLAEQVRDAFNGLAHTTAAGMAVTVVETTLRPHWVPWDNTTVRRFTATYQLYCTAA